MIQITSDEITEAKRKKEAYKERIHSNLEKEKKALIDRLEKSSAEAEAGYQQDYAATMDEFVAAAMATYSSAELSTMEASFRQAKAEEKGVEGRKEDVRESAEYLAEKTNSEVVITIGSTFVLYRRNLDKNKYNI